MPMLAVWVLMMLGLVPGSRAAGAPDHKAAGYAPYTIIFTPINNNAIAGSGVEDQVKATVIDQATGLPVPNFPILIKFDNSVSSDNQKTDASGNYIVKLVGDQVGQTAVHVTAAGVISTYTFYYVAGTPDPTNSATQLVVDVPAAPDDGNTPTTIHAHIVNQFGANYPGLPVTFTIVGGTAKGTAVVTVVNGTTDANGNAVINITNFKPGTVIFTATYTYGGAQVPITNGSPATVTFVAKPDPTNPATQLIVDVPKAPADGNSTTTIHAHVVGDDGNPLPGSKVVFTAISGTAFGTQVVVVVGTGYTDANGDAYINIKNTQWGTVNFTATAQDLITTTTYPITNGSPATVTFTSVTPDPNNPATALIVDVPTAAAGGGITTIHAHIIGTDGLPMQGAKVVFTVSGGSAGGTAVVTLVGSALTDANGNVYINITNPNVGDVNFTATVQYGAGPVVPITNGSPAIVHFVPPPPDPSNPATALIVDVPSVPADGKTPAVIRAHIVGTDGKVQAGVPVTFTISGGTAKSGAIVVIINGTTDANGDAVINIKNFDVGTVSFTATATDPTTNIVYPITNGSPATVNFVVGSPTPGDPGGGGSGGTPPGNGGVPPGSGNGGGTGGPGTNPGGGNGNNGGPGDNKGFTLLFIRNDYQLADGKAQDSVLALVTDGLPKPHALPGVLIDFYIQSAPLPEGTATATAQFSAAPLQVMTDDSGMARIAITNTKPGTVYVYAVLHAQNVLIDGSYQIAHFKTKPDINNPETRLSVVIYEALADGSQQTAVKAHVVDLNGEVMVGEWVKFKVDSGSADIVGGVDSVMTDANGDATIYFTSKTPGYANITATVEGLQITFGSPARVKFAMINIYVPKVFTPNNDGTNDLLKPILVGIQTFHYFSVYNRWGNLIYTTQDPNRGWDGTFKGVAQPVETYLWMAEGIDVEGKRVLARGMTSLVR